MTALTEEVHDIRDQMSTMDITVNGLTGAVNSLKDRIGRLVQPRAFGVGSHQHQTTPAFGAFGAASAPDPSHPFTFSAAAPMELDNQRGRDLYSRPRQRSRRVR